MLETKIKNDPSASFWLKREIDRTKSRDSFDVLNDLEVLTKIVEGRIEALKAKPTSYCSDDFIGEVEIYMAYGKFELANAMLLEHLEKFPDDYKAKQLISEIEALNVEPINK